MLIIDKNISTSTFYLTVSKERSSTLNHYFLEIISTFSNKTYSLLLGENLSMFQSRYDKFSIADTNYFSWEVGTYRYKIHEYNTTLNELVQVIEEGLLKVENGEPQAYRSLAESGNEATDEFKVYQGI